MTRQFDVNWPHGFMTMRGQPARIVDKNVHRFNDCLMAVIVTVEKGLEAVFYYKQDGRYEGINTGRDLQNAPEPKQKKYLIFWRAKNTHRWALDSCFSEARDAEKALRQLRSDSSYERKLIEIEI